MHLKTPIHLAEIGAMYHFVIMGELLKCSNLQNFSIACGYQRKLATNAALRRVREERMAPSRSTETKRAAIHVRIFLGKTGR